jgi:hypothetical protein
LNFALLCLSVCLGLCLSVYLSVSLYLSLFISLSLSLFLYLSLSLSLSLYLSLFMSLSLYFSPFISLSLFLSLYLTLFISLNLFRYLLKFLAAEWTAQFSLDIDFYINRRLILFYHLMNSCMDPASLVSFSLYLLRYLGIRNFLLLMGRLNFYWTSTFTYPNLT